MLQVAELVISFGLVSEELATQLNNSQSKIIIADENLVPVASAARRPSTMCSGSFLRFLIWYAHWLDKGRGTFHMEKC